MNTSLNRIASTSVQRGVFAVEFSFVLIILLLIIFGVIELARLIYMLNTLQETTRNAAAAAAVLNPVATASLDSARQRAVFRNSPGMLAFGSPITDEHVLIDYLANVRDSSGNLTMQPISPANLPSSPAANKRICMLDPNNESCIRFVRARICEPGSACTQVRYQPLVSLINLPIKLPLSTTIVPAESLGFEPGSSP